MALEVRNNLLDKTHENEAFRRMAQGLTVFFEQQGWNGLMIGNPIVEDNENFSADILLFTPTAFLILDLKDYEGELSIPPENGFNTEQWYINNTTVVKGGNNINPFVQLSRQRERFKSIIKTYDSKFPHFVEQFSGSGTQDKSRAVALFRGPITIKANRSVPGKFRWFSIIDEARILNSLIDFKDGFAFTPELGNFLKTIFKADPYTVNNSALSDTNPITNEIDRENLLEWQNEALGRLKSFLSQTEKKVFVLNGYENCGKTTLIPFIEEMCFEIGSPQVKRLVMSNRIAARQNKKHQTHLFGSIYSFIYGGKSSSKNDSPTLEEQDDDDASEAQQIPIRDSSAECEKNAIIIVDDCHLVTDSEVSSDLLQFGTGRLLTDLLTFLDLPQTQRKLIFIGDPYQLSFGDSETSPCRTTYFERTFGLIADEINLSLPDEVVGFEKNAQALKLARSIQENKYNELVFKNSQSVQIIDSKKLFEEVTKWLQANRSFAILNFDNEACEKTNQYIKTKLLSKTSDVEPGDLIVFCNTTRVISNDSTVSPQYLLNGQFGEVVKVGTLYEYPVASKNLNKIVILTYRSLTVRPQGYSTAVEILSLENYRTSPKGELPKEEHVALRIHHHRIFKRALQNFHFVDSSSYRSMQIDPKIQELEQKISAEADEKIKSGLTKELEKIRKQYIKAHEDMVKRETIANDHFLQAAYIRFGWSLTVHKALGEEWPIVVVNTAMGNNSRKNKSYYQWLYSAITRSSGEIFLVNFESHTPLSGANFQDANDIHLSSVRPTLTNPALPFELLDAPETFRVEPLNCDNKAIAIKQAYTIVQFLEGQSFKIESVEGKSFAVKIRGVDDTAKPFVLVFNFDAQGKTTKPRFERAESTAKTILQAWLNPDPSKFEEKQKKLPEDFRKSIYQNWKNKLLASSWKWIEFEPMNYRDRIWLEKGNDWLVFDVVYDGDFFITNVSPFKTNSLENWNEVRGIIQQQND